MMWWCLHAVDISLGDTQGALGACALALPPGVPALRRSRSLHGSPQSHTPARRQGDRWRRQMAALLRHDGQDLVDGEPPDMRWGWTAGAALPEASCGAAKTCIGGLGVELCRFKKAAGSQTPVVLVCLLCT
ncbi:hypothetical protein SKAU_G00050740 [Synaphobranchus kaupii]|uniref:Uncharacterized protein n=1 Tax=Synaphobranchus kaupii TaxID=118154 RepID=A0A9Q1G2Z7_SYNKA|nr:hypothetical protein SKAU_G00050740 [Synaphobranchus kaupii]